MTTLLTHGEITRLTAAERLALIAAPWGSLDDEQLPIEPAQREELARRLDSFEEDRAEGVTGSSLRLNWRAARRDTAGCCSADGAARTHRGVRLI